MAARDETSVTGGLKSLSLRIPLAVEAEPVVSAAWTIAEAIVDYLAQNGLLSSADSMIDEADAAAARADATGRAARADANETQLGEALGEAVSLVIAHRRMSLDQFAGLYPRRLAEAGASSVAAGGGGGGGRAGGQQAAMSDLFGPGGGGTGNPPQGGSRVDGPLLGAAFGGLEGFRRGGLRGAAGGAILGGLGGAATDSDVTGSVVAGAATGLALGSRFGPVGAGVGALAGGGLAAASQMLSAPSAEDAAFGPAGGEIDPYVGPVQGSLPLR